MKSIAYPQEIGELIDRFRQLPGIGRRGAERMVANVPRRIKPGPFLTLNAGFGGIDSALVVEGRNA